MALRFLALSAMLAVSLAAPQRQKAVHERKSLPPAFSRVGAANATAPLTLRLALKNSDAAGLVDALMRVSDPASASYGQHLSKVEVRCVPPP